MSTVICKGLRPYITLASAEDRNAIAQHLEEKTLQALPQGYGTALIAACDGSAERCRDLLEQVEKSHSRSALIDEKDARFYNRCYHALRLCEGIIIDERTVQPDFDHAPEDYRYWQDACVAVFPGENSLHTALVAAVYLHRSLAEYNKENTQAQPDHIHARVSSGSTLEEALRLSPYAWQNETVVNPQEFSRLPRSEQEILLTGGLRIGPTKSDK